MYFFDTFTPLSTRPLCTDDTNHLYSYNDWYTHAACLATYIPSRTLVAIFCTNTAGSLLSYLSCLQNRIVPIMIDSTLAPELQQHILCQYQPEYIFQPRQSTTIPPLYTIADYGVYKNPAPSCKLYKELALLLTTSGSTGSPKLVRQSYTNLHANASSIATYLNLTSNQYPISTLPMHYTFGLSVIHSHVYCGAAIRLTQHTIFEKEFWHICQHEKITSLAGVPFTYACLDKIGFTKMNLPHLTLLIQAGGRLGKPLQEKFGTFAQSSGKQFIVMYGQTEATARMSYLPSDQCLKKLGSIGIAIPGGTFKIMENNHTEITEAHISGELYYEGKNVTLGYAQTRDDLKKEDEFKGKLFTGDIAYKDEDGYFYIVGRKKRFIKLAGKRFNLDEAEQILKTKINSPHIACTGTDDYLQIFVTTIDSIPTLHTTLSETFGLHAQQYKINIINKIPLNSSGKVQYTQLPTSLQ
ncbi:AMP-binding protein [uncultured Megasphaera sp.]|uniref:AMP-binding protein n=1 Tax=uncultured Megasphaera sp. TaxID=165188 RepID=UPI0025972BF5|nr:AMP-binding protein [uncultured Megasphaera sp.]